MTLEQFAEKYPTLALNKDISLDLLELCADEYERGYQRAKKDIRLSAEMKIKLSEICEKLKE